MQKPQNSNPTTRKLYSAIGQLKQIDRLITMLLLEELSYEEIGDVLGISAVNLRGQNPSDQKETQKISAR